MRATDRPTPRRVPQPMLVFLTCAAVLLLVMALAIFGSLASGANWIVGLPLNLIPALGVTILLWASAFGLGDPIRRWLLPGSTTQRLFAQAALGMAALLLLFFVLFVFVAVNRITAFLPIMLGVGLLFLRLYRDKERLSQFDITAKPWPWTLPVVMPGVALLLVAAACPPGTLWRIEALGYDVTSYHLQIPKEWIALGKATPLNHNVYSFFPGLIEHSYTAIGLLLGGARHDAVYACQVFHASFALLVVWGLVEVARRFGATAAALVAGGALLLTPWVIITGSLAYNELAALGFGAASLAVALLPGALSARRGIALGLLLGTATLCKLTAGPMLAIPIALLALWPDKIANDPTASAKPTAAQRFKFFAVVVAAGLFTLTPYLVRNTIATGNPIFPFATSTLGSGHWNNSPWLAERWQSAHATGSNHVNTREALHRQWLGNTGYGALGGTPIPPESHNIARFTHERGLPVLWLAALTGFALMLGHPRTWRFALAMLGILLYQLLFWRLATHLQSRFLLYTLLPGCAVLAIGAGRVREITHTLRGVLPPIATMLLILTLLTTALTTLWHQTPRIEIDGVMINRPLFLSIDALGDPDNPDHMGRPGTHPINLLDPNSKTLIIADNSALLYIDRPMVYSSAFDANVLGEIVRNAQGEIDAINAALRSQGITHVWVVWSEVRRLMMTYGFDPALTPDLLIALAQSWQPTLIDNGQAQLYRIPPPRLQYGRSAYNQATPHPRLAP